MANETQKPVSRYAKLSPELRIIFLRTSCFSILVMEIFTIVQTRTMLNNNIRATQPDVWHGIILMAVLPLMFIHHAACLFMSTLMVAWVDLLLIPEFGFIAWILTQGYAVIIPLSDRTSPFLVLSAFALLLCLFALMMLRIGDFFGGLPLSCDQPKDESDPAKHGTLFRIFGRIFGMRIQEPFYKGETEKIIVSRVLLTVLFLVLFPFYITSKLVVEPLQSVALMTVRKSFSKSLPPNFGDITDAHWTVVITNSSDRHFYSPQAAQQALEAIAVVKLTGRNDSETSRCVKGSYVPSATATIPDHVFFNCLARSQEIAQQSKSGITSGIQQFVIIVYANYNDTFNATVPNMYVRMGLTNDTIAVITGTRPAILGERQNMIGSGEVIVRRELRMKALATLGVFYRWNTYLLANIDQYFNDPTAAANGFAGPGMSSMIVTMENARYKYTVIEDYIEKTVLDGFSAIGGLFGLIGATAALLFGRSIVQLMFGLKHLSLFGIVHKFDEKNIKEAFKTEYPHLDSDLSKKGYVYLLNDRVLDIESAVASSERGNLGKESTKDDPNSDNVSMGHSVTEIKPAAAISEKGNLGQESTKDDPNSGNASLGHSVPDTKPNTADSEKGNSGQGSTSQS